MLKRMACPNASASATPGTPASDVGATAAAARGKRKVRGVGHAYENGGRSVHARHLLHKLERKVRKRAQARDPPGGGGSGEFVRGRSRRSSVVVLAEKKGKLLHSVRGFPPLRRSPYPIRVHLPGKRTRDILRNGSRNHCSSRLRACLLARKIVT